MKKMGTKFHLWWKNQLMSESDAAEPQPRHKSVFLETAIISYFLDLWAMASHFLRSKFLCSRRCRRRLFLVDAWIIA
jgi:hypothetical protein